MSRVRVHNLSISLDGYAAGRDMSEEDPMGVGGMALHQWALATQAFHDQHATGAAGQPGTLEDALVAAGVEGIGATVMGRRMWGPSRDDWQGWWGEEPPFHHPVFVVTSTPREPLVKGETTFHFVTDGVAAAVERAKEAAGDRDVRLGGGAMTVRTAMELGLVDSLHLAQVPVLLGAGQRLWEGPVDYLLTRSEQAPSGVLHLHLEKA
ncbi:MAG: dihydrofolate reductase family protein [Mycobacteriales bacterium]|nr:dihydrofolate reductase family protein [Mycobacteriales bacterium]